MYNFYVIFKLTYNAIAWYNNEIILYEWLPGTNRSMLTMNIHYPKAHNPTVSKSHGLVFSYSGIQVFYKTYLY